jgi:regulator of sirC expression with transglutaminase-like and TPR domain
MPTPQQLPYLLRLLEDESIRSTVLTELAAFGPSLESEIERQGILLNAQQALSVRSLLNDEYRKWIVGAWKEWMEGEDGEVEKLERAHQLLAQFQLGRLYPAKLRTLLDALADEYDARYTERDALLLAEFLFQGYALRGVEQDDYYNPLNSNLVYVIEQRRGIPISLACIYILVGERLGLKVEGLNYPGHFLALARHRRKEVVVDCYNEGAVVDMKSLSTLTTPEKALSREDMRCDTAMIMARVLRNLSFAYEQAGADDNARTMLHLHRLLMPQLPPNSNR